ncbi:MAG: hypothetical protein ABJC05_02450 [Pyrinomonadaceae bacterium]
MFVLLGIATLLAALLTFNSGAAISLAALWRVGGRFTRSWSAATQAKVLFALRSVPAALAILLVSLFLLPAYLAYEPRTTTESVSFKLALLALISSIGIGLALFRGFAAWRATRRLTKNWLAHGEPISLKGIDVAAYFVEHPFPIIAIVGVFRPRLFIARRVLDALTDGEIVAAAAHERGHLIARDNLKRGLLRACRDALLIIPCGRSLDLAWAEAAETAADEYAAQAGRAVPLDLAAALVKIARMIPEGARPTMPAGAFLVDDYGGVMERVRRLVRLTEVRLPERKDARTKLSSWAFASLLIMGLATLATNARVLMAAHSAIERIIYLLT